jgi:hypothetical protein
MGVNGYRLIGRGIYTIPEALRLTRVPRSTIRRWSLGHRFRFNGQEHESSGLEVVPKATRLCAAWPRGEARGGARLASRGRSA